MESRTEEYRKSSSFPNLRMSDNAVSERTKKIKKKKKKIFVNFFGRTRSIDHV